MTALRNAGRVGRSQALPAIGGPGLWKAKAFQRCRTPLEGWFPWLTRLAASGQDLLLLARELFGGDHSPVAQVSQLGQLVSGIR